MIVKIYNATPPIIRNGRPQQNTKTLTVLPPNDFGSPSRGSFAACSRSFLQKLIRWYQKLRYAIETAINHRVYKINSSSLTQETSMRNSSGRKAELVINSRDIPKIHPQMINSLSNSRKTSRNILSLASSLFSILRLLVLLEIEQLANELRRQS